MPLCFCYTSLLYFMFFFFFKQKTAYEIGLGLPYTTLFRSACVYGTLDFVGYPRFPAPVEFIAAVIAYYVHPVNIQTACLIMEGAEFTENIINGVERPVKAAELFAFTLRVRAGKDRKSGSAGMPRPISYAVFCLKKKTLTLAMDIRKDLIANAVVDLFESGASLQPDNQTDARCKLAPPT